MSGSAEGLVFPSYEVAACPYPHFDELRRSDPVHRVPGREEFLLTRYEDVCAVLADPETFSSTVAERLPDGTIIAASLEFARSRDGIRPLQQADPPEHALKRRVAFDCMKPNRVAAFEPTLARIVDGLIDRFAGAGEVDFVERFATPLPALVMHAFLGLPEEDASLAEMWGRYEGQATRYHDPDRREAIAAGIRGMGEYVLAAVTERLDQPRDDILSEFVAAHVEAHGEFRADDVVADASNLLLGGIVTSSHMLGWTMKLLLEQSTLVDWLEDRPRAVRMIEESLRLESPVAWTSRLALEDTEIAGTPIPAGAVVICHLGAANRDAAHFSDPDKVAPGRDELKDHVAFGRRSHFCIGAPLARLEGRLAFERLFARLPRLRLADRNDFEPLDSLAFRGLRELWVEFDAC